MPQSLSAQQPQGLLAQLQALIPRGMRQPVRGGRFYLPQLLSALALVAFGAVVIWSASLTIANASFARHLVGIAIGLLGAYGMYRYDYRALANMSRPCSSPTSSSCSCPASPASACPPWA